MNFQGDQFSTGYGIPMLSSFDSTFPFKILNLFCETRSDNVNFKSTAAASIETLNKIKLSKNFDDYVLFKLFFSDF